MEWSQRLEYLTKRAIELLLEPWMVNYSLTVMICTGASEIIQGDFQIESPVEIAVKLELPISQGFGMSAASYWQQVLR